MRDRYPTPGEPRKKSHPGRYVLLMLFAGAVASGVWGWKRRHRDEAPAASPSANAVAPLPNPGSPVPMPVKTAPTANDILKQSGVRFISVNIDGPLERSLVASNGRDLGQALAQVVTRTLVWWISVPGDLRKGDKLDILFEARATEEPIVHALRLTSPRAAKTFRGYRFKPQGSTF